MTVNRIYRHKENGKYYVLWYSCKVKNQKTREWEDGYVYTCPANPGEVYVRIVKDFEENFDEEMSRGVKFVGPQIMRIE